MHSSSRVPDAYVHVDAVRVGLRRACESCAPPGAYADVSTECASRLSYLHVRRLRLYNCLIVLLPRCLLALDGRVHLRQALLQRDKVILNLILYVRKITITRRTRRGRHVSQYEVPRKRFSTAPRDAT